MFTLSSDKDQKKKSLSLNVNEPLLLTIVWTTPDAAVVYQPRILLHLSFDLIFPDILEYFLA